MRKTPSYTTSHAPPTVRVINWRRRRLERAGFDAALAGTLASDPRFDLHAVLELIDCGCPPQFAARILAPIDRTDGTS